MHVDGVIDRRSFSETDTGALEHRPTDCIAGVHHLRADVTSALSLAWKGRAA